MKTSEILTLLEQLNTYIADDLEGQELDFKEWNERSNNDAENLAVKMAVCMSNGGGGVVIFGVRDKVRGRNGAIKGVPLYVDAVMLQKTIYDRTEPHITANFEWITVPEGTGKILVMRIFPGMPPYTETDGSATIRVGKDCKPLTGSVRKDLMEQSGTADFTANLTDMHWKELFSAVAMERIRMMMTEERAPDTLASMSDEDLLSSVGAIKNGRLTFGGLLLTGTNDAIARYIPNHYWSFRKMLRTTDYSIKDDGVHAIPIALYEMERYMAVDNPSTTIEVGFVHPEFSKYPKIALREALLNAFMHRDYRIPSAVMLKHYPDKLILTNPGTFIGGITSENILHHQPVTRNAHLADLLDKLRLVNRSNLGVPRIYKALLIEGKEPPQYRQVGESIELTMLASTLVPAFRRFVKKMADDGVLLDVDHLIILNYLLRHREITSLEASNICQRSIEQARELLNNMENQLGLLQSGGASKGKYYTLKASVYALLERDTEYDRDKRLDKESMKIRILTLLKERNLTNEEIRQFTGLTKLQVVRMMHELEIHGIKLAQKGRSSYYYLEFNDS
ncbi:MAG: putative DNA binding domain-containing protein [Syntrophomonadaceae bacterium]|nr:putative DNA binding domain-containing protein [Syntrophomonadaceae bacterium]